MATGSTVFIYTQLLPQNTISLIGVQVPIGPGTGSVALLPTKQLSPTSIQAIAYLFCSPGLFIPNVSSPIGPLTWVLQPTPDLFSASSQLPITMVAGPSLTAASTNLVSDTIVANGFQCGRPLPVTVTFIAPPGPSGLTFLVSPPLSCEVALRYKGKKILINVS